jgi:diguanylate cyclase (GGDEF)-like protein
MNWTGRNFDYSKRLAEESARSLTIFVVIMFFVLGATVFFLIRSVSLGRKLKEMAHNDSLTGLYNRRYFMELASIQASRSLRTAIDAFIIIFDLDHFKAVNDTYGHLAGDKVLKSVVDCVKKTIRPYDILGRYGGEEFIILMTDIKEINKDNVIAAVERIRLEICREPIDFEGVKIPVSASFGIAYAAPHNDISTATKYADEALYRAKESGRNRAVFYGE